MTKRDKITELEEQIEELTHEKAEAERICGNMEVALSQARGKIRELECKLENSENQRMELLNRCDELDKQLEERKQDLPIEPMEVAQMLINATFEYDETTRNIYDIDQLEQIAEHLLIYCKHNKEVEE